MVLNAFLLQMAHLNKPKKKSHKYFFFIKMTKIVL